MGHFFLRSEEEENTLEKWCNDSGLQYLNYLPTMYIAIHFGNISRDIGKCTFFHIIFHMVESGAGAFESLPSQILPSGLILGHLTCGLKVIIYSCV